jgi:hypothetical protein
MGGARGNGEIRLVLTPTLNCRLATRSKNQISFSKRFDFQFFCDKQEKNLDALRLLAVSFARL